MAHEALSALDAATMTRDRARDCLLGLQADEGWWKGELETNVTMDAEDLLLREFLGIRADEETAAAAKWIRSNQRDDGTWANFYGGPPDLSTTIEAYVALKLAGDDPGAPHMQKASTYVRDAGGVEGARVFTRIWLALFGLWSWDDLPALPPEFVCLPRWFPGNIYDFGCWARQTAVAITVVAAHRPSRPIAFGVDELLSGRAPERPRPGLGDWASRFMLLDRVLQRYEQTCLDQTIVRNTVREWALRRAENWIVRRQEADGSWGGIQPPWVYSILALSVRGYPVDHPVMRAAFDGLERFLIRDGEARRLEACQSPVWDTALAVIALSDAGVAGDDKAMQRAAQWMLDEEVTTRGDWAVRRPNVPTGGWAFEFANDNYPDIDDTAEVVLALRRVELDGSAERAIARGIAWVEGMASADGAWGAFDADNIRDVLYQLPFCDFGAVIDPPSADVTAHVIEMLAKEPAATQTAIRDGVDWLLNEQEDDGSWFGRWGVNYIYGTGAAIPALVGAGVDRNDPAIRRAAEFLEAHQNDDGGWGEDIRSYDDPVAWRGVGTSTASQTAWALLALCAAGLHGSPAALRGVEFLVESQRADGNWDEPWYTGTGFPGDFYLNYHLYRLVFPLSALGRWCAAMATDQATDSDARDELGASETFAEEVA